VIDENSIKLYDLGLFVLIRQNLALHVYLASVPTISFALRDDQAYHVKSHGGKKRQLSLHFPKVRIQIGMQHIMFGSLH
jgi:hypothetical protein